MNLEQIDLKETGCFSPLFLDYINQKADLKSFYNLYPEINQFEKAIKSRSFSSDKRKVLHSVLTQQYTNCSTYNGVKTNIDLLLKDNTFTITTGHQLNIFTGPLYFIYKILTVINTCEVLKKAYPDYNFVPVYWMASEDHDFAEINHFHLYGKKYQWAEEAKGAVGRLVPERVLRALPDTEFIPERFKNYYKKSQSLSEATRQLVNDLFGKDGLIVIEPDNRSLKDLFKVVIKKELIERKSFEKVTETTSDLESLGYKSQIAPREINLFYLDNELRERLEWKDNEFRVMNSDLVFSEKEILKIVEETPEKFSPNVVLRPVYQETILPNLAYIGGPAEVVYWLQLKQAFQTYTTHFPMLMPRNFALVVDRQSVKKFEKLDIPIEKLFLDDFALKTFFIERNSKNSYRLNEEIGEVEMVFSKVREKALRIDRSLNDRVGADFQRVKKIMEHFEKKLRKAEERNQDTDINRLFSLKAKLFPQGNLQERHDNFLNFYISDENFIQKLKVVLNPLDFKFNVIIDNEES